MSVETGGQVGDMESMADRAAPAAGTSALLIGCALLKRRAKPWSGGLKEVDCHGVGVGELQA